ncbi:MAG: 1-acyl-sn-glycerol-3-phosphate acyltransferase [Fimbriimonadaceae bacterium]|nr:1-acyl-sn-glycerol-3-phosphate acyltransferase [Fimbriimonadaceae bacterium]
MAGRARFKYLGPQPSLLWKAFARFVVVPGLKKFWMRIHHVRLDPPDLARLQAVTRGPALICPNHPSLHEPVLVFEQLDHVSAQARYMIAASTMQDVVWAIPFLRGIGGYSIRRGTTDRAAFAATREHLRDGRAILAFPEGETYGLNDTLIAFQEGIAQLGFWGAQDRQKAGLGADVKLLPIAIKYAYLKDMTAVIDARLARLEEQLRLPPLRLGRYDRLRRVGQAVLSRLERRSGLAVAEQETLDHRLERLYRELLSRHSAALEVRPLPHETTPERLRRLFNALEERLDAASLPASRRAFWQQVYRDLACLQTFQAVRDEYVKSYPSAERYLDVIGRLEKEVSGRDLVYGPRRAIVRVGEPIHLADHLAAYEQDRRAAVTAVTTELRARVAGLLAALAQEVPPLAAE